MTEEKNPTQQIDDIIKNAEEWKGKKLSLLRNIITQADPEVIEEVKWKKPSKPEGVAVWSHSGIICVADILKNAVRLTFPKGAKLKDPKKLFNTRLDSNSVRAIDFFDVSALDEEGLKLLIIEGVRINQQKEQKK